MEQQIPAPLPAPSALRDPAGNTSARAAAGPRPAGPGPARAQAWLLAAAGGLGVLAGAAAAVSYAAQFQLVDEARHLAVAAALEAAIPDAAALVFACLGVALALQGRRAVRARLLNLASAGASVLMNVIAAAPGWRNLAVWAMPPTAYALASDTLIGVVRAGAGARDQHAGPWLLPVLGGLARWLLRLAMAPRSTAAGFRAWVVEECPVAPGRRAHRPPRPAGPGRPEDDLPDDPPVPGPPRPPGATQVRATKTARFLALVTEQHGPLTAIPVTSVAGICAATAPAAGLNTGSARKALRRAVLSAQNQPAPPKGDR